MTRKQFRKNKRQTEEQKLVLGLELEKPAWADPDKIELKQDNWRAIFLTQFPWHGIKKSIV